MCRPSVKTDETYVGHVWTLLFNRNCIKTGEMRQRNRQTERDQTVDTCFTLTTVNASSVIMDKSSAKENPDTLVVAEYVGLWS